MATSSRDSMDSCFQSFRKKYIACIECGLRTHSVECIGVLHVNLINNASIRESLQKGRLAYKLLYNFRNTVLPISTGLTTYGRGSRCGITCKIAFCVIILLIFRNLPSVSIEAVFDEILRFQAGRHMPGNQIDIWSKTCSIGFMSEPIAAQPMTSISCWFRNVSATSYMWRGIVLSCTNINIRLKTPLDHSSMWSLGTWMEGWLFIVPSMMTRLLLLPWRIALQTMTDGL